MCAFNKLLFVALRPRGAPPNTRPLCPRALTQLFRSRISRRLLSQTLGNWDKSKWIRCLTCANRMFVHKRLPAALCLEWTGKNKACELNWILWETHKEIWIFGKCQQLQWCAGGCWEGPTPPIPPAHLPTQKRRKKRYQTNFKVIKFDYLGQWFSTSAHASESPGGRLAHCPVVKFMTLLRGPGFH